MMCILFLHKTINGGGYILCIFLPNKNKLHINRMKNKNNYDDDDDDDEDDDDENVII